METKKCSKCGRELPVSEFNKNKQAKDGLQCRCKSCQREANREKQERIKKLLGGGVKTGFQPTLQGSLCKSFTTEAIRALWNIPRYIKLI